MITTDISIPSRYNLEHLSVIDSTNRYLKDLGQKIDGEGMVVFADRQTGGYGRYRRKFFCQDGCGLYMSILLRPKISFDRYSTITTMAAVAVSEAIESCFSIYPQIKWVNDIYCGGKKVCGILTEGVFGDDPFAVCGIGINFHLPSGELPSDIADIAGSLFQSPMKPCDFEKARYRLIASILCHFDGYYRSFGDNAHLDGYRDRLIGIGESVTLNLPSGEKTAVIEKLNDDYSLTVRYQDGTFEKLQCGEISVMPHSIISRKRCDS